jgi:phosphohistidine phosphatase
MSRELWILRHAKAKRDDIVEDFDRPLKKRGKQAAMKLGNWLQQQQLIPDWVVSSPAKRTMATATRVLEHINALDITIISDKRLYAEGLDSLKTVLANCPANAQRVLLVGHNPELEDLLIYLVGLDNLPERGKLLPTAALARIIMPDDWTNLAPTSGQLFAIIDKQSLESASEHPCDEEK